MRISAREACVKPHLRTRSDIKCFTHNFRGFNIAVQGRIWTQMVTMLTSCRQSLSEVELLRIVDICKR